MFTGHDIAMSIRAAYLAMHRQTDARLATLGVTADQFVVLAVLAESDAITQQQLVRRTLSDPNTIRAMLVLLENRGLIARQPHPTDGRARLVTLTPKGRRTFKSLWAESESLRQRILDLFQDGEVEALVDYLQRISVALGRGSHRRGHSRALASTQT